MRLYRSNSCAFFDFAEGDVIPTPRSILIPEDFLFYAACYNCCRVVISSVERSTVICKVGIHINGVIGYILSRGCCGFLCKKQLPLLWNPLRQQPGVPLPADGGRDPVLRRGGLSAWISHLCAPGRGGRVLYRRTALRDSGGIEKTFSDCAVTLSLGGAHQRELRAFVCRGCGPLSAPPRDRGQRSLQPAAPAGNVLGQPDALPAGFEGDRLSGRLRVYGGFPGADHRVSGQGHDVSAGVHLPHMVGIGPFVPHHDTPFAKEPGGTVKQTLYLLSLIRILLPRVLLPATTALGTIDPKGRERGILAGGKRADAESVAAGCEGKSMSSTTINCVPGTRPPRACGSCGSGSVRSDTT